MIKYLLIKPNSTYSFRNVTELATTKLQNTVPALLFTNIVVNNSLSALYFTKTFKQFKIIYNIILLASIHSNVNNFYVVSSQHFFITSTPRISDYINVIFLKRIKITRVIIETGFVGVECHKGLVLNAGRNITKVENEIFCKDLHVLANISQCLTTVDVSLNDVACLSVTVASLNPSPYTFFNYIHVSTD